MVLVFLKVDRIGGDWGLGWKLTHVPYTVEEREVMTFVDKVGWGQGLTFPCIKCHEIDTIIN